jgi:hypothetical protein
VKTVIAILKWMGSTGILVAIVTTFQMDPKLGFLELLTYLAFIWFYYKCDEHSPDIAELKRRLKALEKPTPPLHDPYDDVPELTDHHKPTTPTEERTVCVIPRSLNLKEVFDKWEAERDERIVEAEWGRRKKERDL